MPTPGEFADAPHLRPDFLPVDLLPHHRATPGEICAGAVLSGATARRSVLSPGAHLHSFAEVEDSILLHGAEVHRSAVVKRAILDKNVQILEVVQIGVDLEADRERFHVSEGGIVVIPKGQVVE